MFVRNDLMGLFGEREEAIVFLDLYGDVVDIRDARAAYHVRDFKIFLRMCRNDRILCAKRLTRLN